MEKKQSGFSYLALFAKPHTKNYIFSVVFATLGVACNIIPYFAVSKMIIEMFKTGRDGDISFYLTWIGVCVISYAFRVLFHSISTIASHKATFSVISEVRRKIADKLTKVPMGYIINTPSGTIKNTMVEKVDSIEPTLAHVVPEMTSSILVPVAIIIYLFTLDWRMALLSLITIPLGLLCLMGMMKDYESNFAKMTAVSKHMNGVAVEYVNGIEVIKAFGQSASSYQKFKDAVKANAEYGLNWMKACQKFSSMAYGIFPAVLVGVLPVGCLFISKGTLDYATLITVIILALGIIEPITTALYYVDELAKIQTTMLEIGNIVDQEEMIRPEKDVELKGHNIQLKDVTFGYNEKEILHGINLTIPQNTVTAFVGPSGSGKSTISKLIASFWDCKDGEINIGGKRVKDIPLSQLNNLIAYVSQDNYLFNETVMKNIRMGNQQASDDEVIKAAKSAGCHEFILGLENGYNTVVGDAGGHLSGGERQRIAIARAMLKDSKIVIFDEATAYTDPENEAVIQSAVAKLVKDKTLIVIAHRLSTITDSDQIVVVDDGNIVACDTHNQLLNTCELYQNMWEAHISVKDEIKEDCKCLV